VLVSARLAERGADIEHLTGGWHVGVGMPRSRRKPLLAKSGGPDLFEDRSRRLARGLASSRAHD
jgi:hypothetical protein